MPKKIASLSAVSVQQAKPQAKAYKLFDGEGLYLEVTPSGSKRWYLKYRRPDGKENRLSLGIFPSRSLESARRERANARTIIAEGGDPAEARKEVAQAIKAKNEHTFENIARQWHTNKLPTWAKSTAQNTLHRLSEDVFPAIGAVPISDVRPKQIISLLKEIEGRGAPEIAKRMRATIDAVFRYAIQHEIAENNPAASLKDVLTARNKTHFAALKLEDFPEFLSKLVRNDICMAAPTRILMQLMMLTFLRTSELTETPWTEIDFDNRVWIVPWSRMKMGKRTVRRDETDHHVCLSSQGWELLSQLHSLTGRGQWLFPNQRSPRRPISNGAILAALKRMGYAGRMTGHGFRSLATSIIKQELGYRREVIDRQLAHKESNDTHAAYDRADYLPERRKMMQDWANYIDRTTAQAIAPKLKVVA